MSEYLRNQFATLHLSSEVQHEVTGTRKRAASDGLKTDETAPKVHESPTLREYVKAETPSDSLQTKFSNLQLKETPMETELDQLTKKEPQSRDSHNSMKKEESPLDSQAVNGTPKNTLNMSVDTSKETERRQLKQKARKETSPLKQERINTCMHCQSKIKKKKRMIHFSDMKRPYCFTGPPRFDRSPIIMSRYASDGTALIISPVYADIKKKS